MPKTLLAIFAHPDDETFGPGGTLAKYAAEGVAVHLVCATRGEVGESDLDGLGDCEDLACQREQELRCAADVLGLAEIHFLGYQDSGMAGSPANQDPRALVQADPDALAEQVADWMRRLQPQVVLTFDPYGAYGHPDHIAIYRATVAAYERLAEEERPQKLYFTATMQTLLKWTVWLMPLFGLDPKAMGKNKDIDLRAALDHALPIMTKIDVGPYYDAKRQAAACHRSQLSGPGPFWDRLPQWLVRRAQSTETFHRASPPFHRGERVERDLFANIDPEV
ncbi:MAG: PIG-L deacetylase family protein [Anaerolineae bacterium]|jgi:LmbE family N-acetylglucosaminyl deacetylase